MNDDRGWKKNDRNLIRGVLSLGWAVLWVCLAIWLTQSAEARSALRNGVLGTVDLLGSALKNLFR